jgi:hypothetical protein
MSDHGDSMTRTGPAAGGTGTGGTGAEGTGTGGFSSAIPCLFGYAAAGTP